MSETAHSRTNVTPLLGEGERAWNFGSGSSRWWTAELFPFKGEVSTYSPGLFRWQLSLVGAGFPFVSGEEKTWSAAFEAVSKERRLALVSLNDQMERLHV